LRSQNKKMPPPRLLPRWGEGVPGGEGNTPSQHLTPFGDSSPNFELALTPLQSCVQWFRIPISCQGHPINKLQIDIILLIFKMYF